jgi:hypothetical protein
MKRLTTVLLIVGLMAFIASTVSAAAYYTEIQKKIANQQNRIDVGIKKGLLSRDEAQVLQDNLNYIKGEEARLRSDGLLTPNEQKRLMRMLEDNGKMIKEKRHNAVRRLY